MSWDVPQIIYFYFFLLFLFDSSACFNLDGLCVVLLCASDVQGAVAWQGTLGFRGGSSGRFHIYFNLLLS